jgi:hypothetical protein
MVSALRRVPAAAVCALAAHALIYGTLTPSDGAHGYFAWYEPAVAGLSVAALVSLIGFLAVAVGARKLGRLPRVAVVVPAPFGRRFRSLAGSTLAFLLVQESLESSLQAGRPTQLVLTPSQWLLLLAAVAVASAALSVALRACEVVVARMLGATQTLRAAGRRRHVGWTVVTSSPSARRPLAGRFALRAPPLFSS